MKEKKGKKSMREKNKIYDLWIKNFNGEVHDMFRLESFSQHRDSNLSFKFASSVLVWRYQLFFLYRTNVLTHDIVSRISKRRVFSVFLFQSLSLLLNFSHSIAFYLFGFSLKYSLTPTNADVYTFPIDLVKMW